MKALTVAVYLITGSVCLYWSALTFFSGMYGIGFPWWALVVFVGALVLVAGAALAWSSA